MDDDDRAPRRRMGRRLREAARAVPAAPAPSSALVTTCTEEFSLGFLSAPMFQRICAAAQDFINPVGKGTACGFPWVNHPPKKGLGTWSNTDSHIFRDTPWPQAHTRPKDTYRTPPPFYNGAKEDGLINELVERMAGAGNRGAWPGNCHRDIMHALNPTRTETIPELCTVMIHMKDNAGDISLRPHPVLLPHQVAWSLEKHFPTAFPELSGRDRTDSWWLSQGHNPNLADHPMLHRHHPPNPCHTEHGWERRVFMLKHQCVLHRHSAVCSRSAQCYGIRIQQTASTQEL
jgi:hypothetical protein